MHFSLDMQTWKGFWYFWGNIAGRQLDTWFQGLGETWEGIDYSWAAVGMIVEKRVKTNLEQQDEEEIRRG